MADDTLERACKIDTATLSDALDRLGIPGQCFGIKPLAPSQQSTGRAFTLLYGPIGIPPGTVGDYIDDVPADGFVVLDNGGREDATVWGDILTMVAHRRGIAGTLIDGICRDTQLARELGYPIYSRGFWMRTGKDRVQVEATSVPVTIGNVRVAPGDLVRGDGDGVIVIPAVREAEVLEVAEAIEASEAQIREAVAGGLRLDEVRRQLKYHTLQRRRDG